MEDGRVVGTTRSDRIMMPAGRHALTLTSERFGVNQSQAVEIRDGSAVSLTARLPDGTVSVNALPWAKMWIGDRVESAVLHRRVNPIYDRLLLDQTKTWRYTAALKDGTPVKYRKLIAFTLSGG